MKSTSTLPIRSAASTYRRRSGWTCSRGSTASTSRATVAKVPKDIPIYIFSGDRDPAGVNGKGVTRLYEAYKRAGIFDVRLKLYPDGRHEMFNEINRDEVTRDLIDWCDDIVATRVLRLVGTARVERPLDGRL